MNENKTHLEKYTVKSAQLSLLDVSDNELALINKYTLEPLKAEDVFTFKLIMGDNELDDRNFEPFNLNALKDLKKLYIGKTVIKDHSRKADNQIARVYDTELKADESGKLTGAGEVSTQLIAKCYMIKTSSNADLIAEIKAGIKKEVSTGCRPKHAWCSICGVDNTKNYCTHYWGKEYDTKDGKKVCYFTLDGAKEAYEVSFVAVPAQPRAGTTKNYKLDTLEEDNKESGLDGNNPVKSGNDEVEADNSIESSRENATNEVGEGAPPNNVDDEKTLEVNTRMRLLDVDIFIKEKEM